MSPILCSRTSTLIASPIHVSDGIYLFFSRGHPATTHIHQPDARLRQLLYHFLWHQTEAMLRHNGINYKSDSTVREIIIGPPTQEKSSEKLWVLSVMNTANVWAYKPSSKPAKKFFPEYCFRLAGLPKLG